MGQLIKEVVCIVYVGWGWGKSEGDKQTSPVNSGTISIFDVLALEILNLRYQKHFPVHVFQQKKANFPKAGTQENI